MKFFDKNKENDESISEPLKKKILAVYEKAGLLPLYMDAFEKLHIKMMQLREEKLREGMDSDKIEEVINKIEWETQVNILSQGDQKYLKLADKIATAYKDSRGRSSPPSPKK